MPDLYRYIYDINCILLEKKEKNSFILSIFNNCKIARTKFNFLCFLQIKNFVIYHKKGRNLGHVIYNKVGPSIRIFYKDNVGMRRKIRIKKCPVLVHKNIVLIKQISLFETALALPPPHILISSILPQYYLG